MWHIRTLSKIAFSEEEIKGLVSIIMVLHTNYIILVHLAKKNKLKGLFLFLKDLFLFCSYYNAFFYLLLSYFFYPRSSVVSFVPIYRRLVPICEWFVLICEWFVPICEWIVPICEWFVPICEWFVPICEWFIPICEWFVPICE